jgi:hypothetical protein
MIFSVPSTTLVEVDWTGRTSRDQEVLRSPSQRWRELEYTLSQPCQLRLKVAREFSP